MNDVIFNLIFNYIKSPRNQFITCDMSDISFPFLSDTVPFYAVGIYGTLGPLLIILFVEIGNARLFPLQNKCCIPLVALIRKFIIYFLHAIALFSFGLSIVLMLTEIGKRWIGNCILC